MKKIDAQFYDDGGEFAVLTGVLGGDSAAAELFAAEVGLSATVEIEQEQVQQVEQEEII